MNPLLEIIAREIEKSGVISFARFMELALYCPVCGYYEKETDNLGRRGDFFTSVSVGSLFGELLAFQFSDWLETISSGDSPLTIAEAGAHDGRLARDILFWLRERRSKLLEKLEYVIIEPSASRQQRQNKMLVEFSGKVRWASGLEEWSGKAGIQGILFSNELLDAMPVHRIGWDAARKQWFEWGVGLERGECVRTKILPPTCGLRLPDLPDGLLEVLPDEFTTEICPAADDWWRDAARVLKRGKLLTVDFGLSAEEFFLPQRKDGTVRACYRHHATSDLFANVGEQDLTAQVNFTNLQKIGEEAGLRTEALESQEKFLTRIAGRTWKRPADFGEWTAARVRQFQTLTHPEHLGRPFRALIQARERWHCAWRRRN